MTTHLEEEKKKIEEQKRKIQHKEKILKEKEKRKQFKRYSEIVELAFKANIDGFEDSVLLGAFLEISEKMKEPSKIQEWKKIGEAQIKEREENSNPALSISFESDPGKEIKDKLKEMKFRWNSFRREFCGYGDREEMEIILKGTDYSIEEIDE